MDGFIRRYFKPASAVPPIWVIALIAGLPIFSETMYTPSLPHIARFFNVDESWVEYTLSVYLLGTALGTIFWGHLSDYFGRKPALLSGFFLYTLGCVGCFYASSISMLLVTRFVQALGGSVGTVLGQAVAHDTFKGKKRGKVFSTVGAILALAPAVGPVLGGFLDQTFNWMAIFLMLMVWGSFVLLVIATQMPETHPFELRGLPSTRRLFHRMRKDPKVITCGIAVGLANGLMFSFNAEGPFYLIDMLGFSPLTYGLSFTLFALMSAVGSYISRRLHNTQETSEILKKGLKLLALSGVLFAVSTLVLWFQGSPRWGHIFLTLGCVGLLAMGRGLLIANCLSLALEDYTRVAGAATSLFVCFYYLIIALVTTGMAFLHNDTLLPMPLYFFGLGCGLLLLVRFVPKSEIFQEKMPHV